MLTTSVVVMMSCSRVPDYVIPPDDMAEVLADLHVGESYVETNYSDFATDSSRMALKQSVVMRHGYTIDQLDTSFMWYGANLKVYDEVYTKTIDILQERLNHIDAVGSGGSTMAVAGDSVDVWSGTKGFVINDKAPALLTVFLLKSDNNWKRGDSYTWRAKFLNNKQSGSWTIAADYTDGTTEYLGTLFGGDGWQEITFYIDSTRVASRVYGTLSVMPPARSTVYIDSMQLVRNRLNSTRYQQRYRQRTYKSEK